MYRFFQAILDLIFPKLCAGCRAEGNFFCDGCRARITINYHVLPEGKSRFLKGLWVIAYYQQTAVRQAIITCKYRFVPELALILAEFAVAFLKNKKRYDAAFGFDYVVPVPLAARRQRLRGFNQSALIAEAVSQAFGWQFDEATLYRKYNTPPQVGLDASQRLKNVARAFAVRTGRLRGKKILLVDDVVTTGATLRACAYALRQAGALEVWSIVIAKNTALGE